MHDKEQLQDILEVVSAAGEPRIDLGLLLGTRLGPTVSVPNLLDVIATHDEPQVKLTWDEDKSLIVQRTDGGVMATLEVKF